MVLNKNLLDPRYNNRGRDWSQGDDNRYSPGRGRYAGNNEQMRTG